MIVLVDTSVHVELERREIVPEVFELDLAVSVITIAELRRGIERSKDEADRSRRSAIVEGILKHSVEVVDVNLEIATECSRIWVALEQAGRPIPAFDMLIAATATVRGWPLWTRDAHFDRVHGLELFTPPAA